MKTLSEKHKRNIGKAATKYLKNNHHPWKNNWYGNLDNSIKSGYKLPCKP